MSKVLADFAENDLLIQVGLWPGCWRQNRMTPGR